MDMTTTGSSDFNTGKRVGRLRIGLFTDTYAPQVNGVSISLQLIAQRLQAAGHQVTIFAPRFPGYKDPGQTVFRIPSLRYMNRPPIYVAVLGTPRTTWRLSRRQFDVLHAHSPLSVGLLAYVTASVKSLPLIYTYHTAITDYTHYVKIIGETDVLRRAARWFSKASTNLGDQIVVPSVKIERLLQAQKVRRPIHVIPNGIDLSQFRNPMAPGKFRAKLGLKKDDPILLSVGRLDPEKSLDFLITAFAHMIDQIPNAHLVFAGDGGARKNLEALAAATQARSNIHFLGMVDRAELPDLLHDATLFLTASTTEVQPLSVIEAIACGLPVVAVQDDSFAGMIEDGVNGYLVAREVEAFNSAVYKLLGNDVLLGRFRENSLRLSEKFSIESQVSALETLYFEAILQNWRGQIRPRLSSRK